MRALVIENPGATASFSAINVPEPPKPREKVKPAEGAPKEAGVSWLLECHTSHLTSIILGF